MTKKLNDILNGVKSSKIETTDVSDRYQWNSKDGEEFIQKHKIEKHEDRVGNSDEVYKGKTKKADYKRQSDGVYEEVSEKDWQKDNAKVKVSKNSKFVNKMINKWGKRGSAWLNHPSLKNDKKKVKEEVEDLEEKYEGFKKLKSELAAKGAKTPGALAAWIGRKKYGKEKFQKAAASDHKMKEDDSCSSNTKKKMLFDKDMKEDSCSTPKMAEKNPFSTTTGSNTSKQTTPKQKTDTTPKSLSKVLNKEKVEIQETAPPNPKIEKWIKSNKNRFVKEYGKEKGMEVLYAKAWKMHNESSPATTTDYAGPGAAGWTTGRMDTGTL